MEHEENYQLMMEALDGEISTTNEETLNLHLQACPSCMQEWQMLQAIDGLLRETPALAPAIDFAQRTVAALPNRLHRRWSLSLIYLLTLAAGTLPIAVGMVLIIRFLPLITTPDMLQTLWQPVAYMADLVGAVLNALLISSIGFLTQQPAVIGLAFVLLGIITIWGGVFQRHVLTPNHLPAA